MSVSAALPLDQREILDGGTAVPALDPRWISKTRFVTYMPPPNDLSDQGQRGEWLERLHYIATDLRWLLQLPHHKFWCQVIFDETLHHTLDSFLRFAPRSYDRQYSIPTNAQEVHSQVMRLIFFTYLRMSTHKESKENWITPKVFGEILYENFLFDIPKLLDLCALYGHSNGPLLTKMVTNIFTHQPRYLDDLRATAPTLLQVLSNIVIRSGMESSSPDTTPQKLQGQSRQEVRNLENMSNEEFYDLLLFLSDTAVSLATFLTIYPPSCSVLHEFQFCQHLASMYEKVIPAFQAALKQQHHNSTREKQLFRFKLQQARQHLLMTFHLILSHTCLQPVMEKLNTPDEISKHVEDFLSTMSDVLGEKRFLADYEGQYSFQDDLEILSQAAGVLDDAHCKYIQEAINNAFAAHGTRKKPKGNTNTGGRTSPDGSPCPPLLPSNTDAELKPQDTPVAASASPHHFSVSECNSGLGTKRVTGIELESLIYAVKDLLPGLSDDFVKAALAEFDYNPELAVSAFLEDKLPDSLKHFSQPQEGNDAPSQVVNSLEPLEIEARRNIFDNDDFDVFHTDAVNVSAIHKGKRNKEAVLNDKSTIDELKPLYDAYGSMDVPSMYDKQVYEDEYDDTYDALNVGADDADSADELTQQRPFTVPRVLQQKESRPEESEESSEEEQDRPEAFVEDPATVRARQEAKFGRSQQETSGKYDVKGRGRGAGQTDQVLRNRRWKESHKGSRANHNRRAMADKKMKKGMF
ncbi:hypothetical protein C0Q70_12750 [Pomacea canaliculata]|uniref:CUE domain-containing protein n=1 Tax=Pomacea canaliculata TaxID=400727 RepID=A0A2T7P2E1_POMCA|nr:activating signal cointegrator 1 complex subunit 2-like isoform X2 [Pomacea canaliculata]PVD27586.1 hypothetical protein C0Q70_12750 [Pomacea canaliculata]